MNQWVCRSESTSFSIWPKAGSCACVRRHMGVHKQRLHIGVCPMFRFVRMLIRSFEKKKGINRERPFYRHVNITKHWKRSHVKKLASHRWMCGNICACAETHETHRAWAIGSVCTLCGWHACEPKFWMISCEVKPRNRTWDTEQDMRICDICNAAATAISICLCKSRFQEHRRKCGAAIGRFTGCLTLHNKIQKFIVCTPRIECALFEVRAADMTSCPTFYSGIFLPAAHHRYEWVSQPCGERSR